MNALYDLKDMLLEQLEEYGKKGELSSSVLEKVDTLAHATKNLDKIIEVCEGEDSGMDDYSNRSYRRSRSGSYYGRSGRRSGRSSRYSRNSSFANQLYSMADDVEDEQTKKEIERLAAKMDQG